MKYFLIFFIIVQFSNCTKAKKPVITDSLREDAIQVLVNSLENASEWEKVHAAEYLLNLGYTDNIRKIFLNEEGKLGSEFYYRIGIWRVLYQVTSKANEKDQWLDSIARVFKITTSPDRIHAAETLAKLKKSPTSFSVSSTDSILNSNHNSLWIFTYWGTAYSSEEDMLRVKNKLIDIILYNNESDDIRNFAMYALFKMKNLDKENWNLLFDKLLVESNNQYLISCILRNTPMNLIMEERVILQKKKVEKKIVNNKNENHSMIIDTYQQIGNEDDILFLTKIMESKNEYHIENKLAAANAILSIEKKLKEID